MIKMVWVTLTRKLRCKIIQWPSLRVAGGDHQRMALASKRWWFTPANGGLHGEETVIFLWEGNLSLGHKLVVGHGQQATCHECPDAT
jgi:hypothetical protein